MSAPRPEPPARLSVRVHPGARQNALLGRLATGEWKLAVSAPPEDGRANDAVVELLAGLLGLKRRQVTVTRGHAARAKQVEVDGMSAADAEARLAAALTGTKERHGE